MPPISRTAPISPAATTRVAGWYEEHGGALYGYLRFHLRSADEAEELMAETFLRAVRAAERFEAARGPARAWLFRIAQNVLRDHRRRGRRARPVPLGAFRDLVSPAPSVEERLLWEEETAALLAAVGELSPADQELIALRYGSGLTAAGIADLVGARETAVRTRLWRALRRLRARLEGLR